MTEWLVIAFLIFLCWGSFLNVVGYRLIHGHSLLGRSFCPHCKTQLAWYDLIPVLSWLTLWGRCRNCRGKISILYPFIELLTAFSFTLLLIYIDPEYWLGYMIYFSALIVTVRTDFETMLIARLMSIGMIPIALLLSVWRKLPVAPFESILGALFGYAVLWIVARVFYNIRKIEGLGEGDLELLAMIGSFTGILGAWTALFIGSFLGTIAGLIVLSRYKRRDIQIAFGPWLALGGIVYVFIQNLLMNWFFCAGSF